MIGRLYFLNCIDKSLAQLTIDECEDNKKVDGWLGNCGVQIAASLILVLFWSECITYTNDAFYAIHGSLAAVNGVGNKS